MITGTGRAAAEAELLGRAADGDEHAFRELTEPYRRELEVHCYRLLGTLADAEDAVQETLLSAWRGLESFERRSSLRTWLYRIATNASLNAIRARNRRPRTAGSADPEPEVPEPTRLIERIELGPYPDAMLEGVPDDAPGPEARYEQREAIELAFMVALQTLPPRQRAALVLRDVLGYPAAETAELLATTPASVNSALQRARATVERLAPSTSASAADLTAADRALLDRFAAAFEDADVDRIVSLMSGDAVLAMPPEPIVYQGRADIARFLAAVPFHDRDARFRTRLTSANCRPTVAVYRRDPASGTAEAYGIMLVSLDRGEVRELTGFKQAANFARFGLEPVIPDREERA